MTDDLRRSLRELPPALDVPADFYDRVMTQARHRQRVIRAGSAGLAAVVVAAVVAVSVALSGTSSTARLVPVTPPPSPSPSPSSLPSPAATTTPSAPSTSPTAPPSAAPSASTVTLGGARLTLPAGWVAVAVAAPANSQPIVPTWCLMPAAGPAPSSQDAAGCSIAFSAVPSGSATPQMSVDTPGGLVGNPEYCDPAQSQTVTLVGYQDTQLGARFADYRIWLYVCADGSRWPVEQYVADNAPGYVLYSSHATAAVHAVLTGIAQTAQLPAITAPLRLSDLGIVRTVTTGAGGYQITVDRVVRGTSGLINNNPQTYPYDVPAAAVLPGQSLKVGDLVELATNGTTVTHLQVDPS